MSTDLKGINRTLQSWFEDAIQRPVKRANTGTAIKQKAYGEYLIKTIRSIGVDDVRKTEVVDDEGNVTIEQAVRGDRHLLVEFRVISRTQDDDCYAMALMDVALTRLRAPWAKDLFKANCLSVIEQVGDVIDMSARYQKRIENIAVMSIRFGAASFDEDPRSSVSTIECINLSSNMQLMGDPLQLVDSPIPAPLPGDNDNNMVSGGNNMVSGGNNMIAGVP